MSTVLHKMIDIGPAGVIYPGSAQDYRYHENRTYLRDTQTPWIRYWADWPSLQPDSRYAIDDPASPGYSKLQALDEQIRLACADGLRVMLLPYRFPNWANGTAAVNAQKNTDPEISFEYWERMTKAAWDRYVREGRNPSVYNPSRRALEYRLIPDAYGPNSQWAKFFDFLYKRYHYGQRASGRYVTAFDLVNEPNLQLWPLMGPAPAGATTGQFAIGPVTIGTTIAQLMATAQTISARYAHSTRMHAPSISDSDTTTSRRYIRWNEFVPVLLDALAARAYKPHFGQTWSHHNYSDVEYRTPATRLQTVRGLLAGRWNGRTEGAAPTVWVTEGGARLSRMAALYPAEDPRQAQAKCLRDAWALHQQDTGQGAGVAMFAQYLLYADPNFDTGLIDPWPSTVKRPAYDAWKAFPKYA